jgi:hypothetical protein
MRTVLIVALMTSAAASAQPSLTATARAGGSLSLNPSRTQGGLGGGVGARLSLDEHWVVQADIATLFGLGVVGLVRAGGGWQRPGRWSPMVRVDLELGFGGSLDFSVEGRLPPRGPTLGLTAAVALLRFVTGRWTISALELGAGLGSDFRTVGFRAGVTLLEVGLAF